MPSVPPYCPSCGGPWDKCSEPFEELFGQVIPGLRGKAAGIVLSKVSLDQPPTMASALPERLIVLH